MSWSNAFVGTPYLDLGRTLDGCDCWGLVRLVYGAELGIELPSYLGAYASADEVREVAALIAQEAATPDWVRVEQATQFDVLVFRQGRYGSHVGIHIDQGRMLHMAEEEHAKVARYDEPRWSRRLVGVFRHFERRSKGVL